MTTEQKNDEAQQPIKTPFKRILSLQFNELAGRKGFLPAVSEGLLLAATAGAVVTAALAPLSLFFIAPFAATALVAKAKKDYKTENAAYEQDLAAKNLEALKNQRNWRDDLEDEAFGAFQFSLALEKAYADRVDALQKKSGEKGLRKSFVRAVKLSWFRNRLEKEQKLRIANASTAIANLRDTLAKESPRSQEYDGLNSRIQKTDETIKVLTQTASALHSADVKDSNASFTKGVGGFVLLANPIIGLLMLSAQGSGNKAQDALQDAHKALTSLQEELGTDIPDYSPAYSGVRGPITQSYYIAERLKLIRDDLIAQRKNLVTETVADKRAANRDADNILSVLEKNTAPQPDSAQNKASPGTFAVPAPAAGR